MINRTVFFIFLMAILMLSGCAIGNDGASIMMTTNNNYIYKNHQPALLIIGENESISLILPEMKKQNLLSGIDFGLLVTEQQVSKDEKQGLYFFLNGKEIGFISISEDGRINEEQVFKEIIKKYQKDKKDLDS